MFIVKAEVEATDGSGVRNSTLLHAHQIRILKRPFESFGGHDFEVELMDAQCNIVDVLLVGSETKATSAEVVDTHKRDRPPREQYFCAVFIMNDSGKTVDRVLCKPK
jgi:hypothetical protein